MRVLTGILSVYCGLSLTLYGSSHILYLARNSFGTYAGILRRESTVTTPCVVVHWIKRKKRWKWTSRLPCTSRTRFTNCGDSCFQGQTCRVHCTEHEPTLLNCNPTSSSTTSQVKGVSCVRYRGHATLSTGLQTSRCSIPRTRTQTVIIFTTTCGYSTGLHRRAPVHSTAVRTLTVGFFSV